jgi:ubiquinone/menaquinone biosynthesis C-methylase UbiE
MGSGNGNTSSWLCQSARCKVTGIDLSGVRVSNAIKSAKGLPAEVQTRLDFKKASGTDLPFAAASFSHVWSQATIYHIPDKEKTLQEIYRVLEPGGWSIFDDLTKPKAEVSDDARRYVYDRLLFDTDFSFTGY